MGTECSLTKDGQARMLDSEQDVRARVQRIPYFDGLCSAKAGNAKQGKKSREYSLG